MKKLFLFLFAVTASLFWSATAFGQIAQVTGSPQTATTTNTTLTITKPSGLAIGNVMLLQIVQSGDGAANSITDIDLTGSGWTQIAGSYIENVNNTTVVRATLYYKIAVNADVSGANFSFTLDADSDDGEGGIIAFSGVDNTGGVTESGTPGGPFDVDPGSVYTGLSNDNNFTASAITTGSANAAVVMFGAISNNYSISNWSTTNPGGLAEIYDVAFDATEDIGMGAAFAIKSATGSTGSGSADLSNNDLQGSILIALKSLPLAPPTPIGCSGQYYVSYGSGTSSSSTTSMSKLSFSGGVITANPFSTDPTGIGYNGIGISPIDGFLYGIRYSPAKLIRVAANAPGNVVDLGAITGTNLGGTDNVYAGCFDSNGDFYFYDDDNSLFRISGINYPAAPLSATLLGTVAPANGFFIDIAIDPTNGQMYGVSGISGTKHLYSINKANGALTLIGTYATTDYIAGLFFDETGNLFGYRQDGAFLAIDKTNASMNSVGSGPSYSAADGCSCSFGRVFHDLDYGTQVINQICPTLQAPNPIFPLTVSVTNQSNAQQTGLTYTLDISDPKKRFRFTEDVTTIKNNMIAAGVATVASTVTLSTEAPATGTNYNKVVVTGFQTGLPGETKQFSLQVQLYTMGGSYDPVPLQSEISGLPVIIGSSDISNDPDTPAPDDETVIEFCPNITLPVELVSFNAKRASASSVNLKWTTAMELNNSGFYIERKIGSADNWETLGFVATQAQGGNSNDLLQYSYNDLNAAKGITQYRLRQVDFDAKATYSAIRSVRGEGQLGKTIVYPNPSSNGNVNVVFEDAGVTRDIAVSDMSGRLVRQIRGISNNNITIENLNPGMYTIRIVAIETGEQVVEKIVVYKR